MGAAGKPTEGEGEKEREEMAFDVEMPSPSSSPSSSLRSCWRAVDHVFGYIWVMVTSAIVMLDIFYWAALYKPSLRMSWGIFAKNIMVHGANLILVCAEMLLTRAPFGSYYIHIMMLYLLVYKINLDIVGNVTGTFAYPLLSWSSTWCLLWTAALFPILVFAIFFNLVLVWVRGKLIERQIRRNTTELTPKGEGSGSG